MAVYAVAVVGGNAVNADALTQKLIPIGRVGIHVAMEGTAGVPYLHGKIALQLFKIPCRGGAPLGVAIDRQILFGVDLVQIGLVGLLVGGVGGLGTLVLGKAVAVLLFRADADGVETAEADVTGHTAVVELHARDHGHAGLRGEILEIIDLVVGKCEKIVAVLGVVANGLFRGKCAVGTGGMAMEPALQHFPVAFKGLLTKDHLSDLTSEKSFLFCIIPPPTLQCKKKLSPES